MIQIDDSPMEYEYLIHFEPNPFSEECRENKTIVVDLNAFLAFFPEKIRAKIKSVKAIKGNSSYQSGIFQVESQQDIEEFFTAGNFFV